jgi:hypothetical protein
MVVKNLHSEMKKYSRPKTARLTGTPTLDPVFSGQAESRTSSDKTSNIGASLNQEGETGAEVGRMRMGREGAEHSRADPVSPIPTAVWGRLAHGQ